MRPRGGPKGGGFQAACLAGLLFLSASAPVRADIQFDVFFGFDGVALSAGWMPMACEVYNDGAGFNAQFELSTGAGDESVTRRMAIELPTKTRKRFVIPVFSANRQTYWRARLLDEKGAARATLENLRPNKEVSWQASILGVVGKGLIRTPEFPEIQGNRKDLQPMACRMQEELFPDNPLALDSLTALYLSSTIALDLTPGQAGAIYTWMERGGHLIVGVDQSSEIEAVPWLRETLPARFSGAGEVTVNDSLQAWLTGPWGRERAALGGSDASAAGREERAAGRVFGRLGVESGFAGKKLLVAAGRVTDGRVSVAAEGVPLIVEARRGYGRITALAFNPDHAPVLGWKHQPWFWLKLLGPNPELYEPSDFRNPANASLDGLAAALIETKQVRKLPVVWLLALLAVYLAVIGPFDWYTLKKLRRQMLTWITFPIYVALFSGLIYFIGFKLRAGRTEWNDLSVVDIWPKGETAFLAGRTYGSIYSPANDRYKLGGSQPLSAMRGECAGRWNMAEEIGQGEMTLSNGRASETGSVPIWTSRLFVTDWLDSARPPFRLQVRRSAGGWAVELENKTERLLAAPRLVVGERLLTLGAIAPGAILRTNVPAQGGEALNNFVNAWRTTIDQAINRHQSAFGQTGPAGELDAQSCALAASFMPDLTASEPERSFLTRDRLVIAPEMRRDMAVLLVWDPASDLAKPIQQFNPSLQTRRNLLRLAVPVEEAAR